MVAQEIYFHVGLGKVASSFLQQRFFPKLTGIQYIPTSQYKYSKRIISSIGAEKILVSREFDRQFEREVRWFTETYPEAAIIIIFRRHDAWLASQYKRHVKNGWYFGFEKFFDLKNDEGLWKQSDLLFYPKLKIIEECSYKKPLVLFYDQLIEDPWSFLRKIAHYTGASFQESHISLKKVHTSYSEKQLKVLRSFCSQFIRKVPDGYKNPLKHWLLYRPYWTLFHMIMYASVLVPESAVSAEPLIPEDALRNVRHAYENDWLLVNAYAKEHNQE